MTKLLPFYSPCPKTLVRTPKSCFNHVYYESFRKIYKSGNSVIPDLTTLFSDGFNDTKIMSLSQLCDKLKRKTEKNDDFLP